MNKTITGIVIGVVVIGGVWYAMSRNTYKTSDQATAGDGQNQTATSSEITQVTAPKQTVGGVYRGTLGGLLSRGGSYKCTFSNVTSAGRSDGTAYISGNRLRVDIKTTFSAGVTVGSHLLYLSGSVYAWTDAIQQGFKAKTAVSTVGTSLGASGSGGFDYAKTADYKCAAWGGDATLFEFPKGITFMNV